MLVQVEINHLNDILAYLISNHGSFHQWNLHYFLSLQVGLEIHRKLRSTVFFAPKPRHLHTAIWTIAANQRSDKLLFFLLPMLYSFIRGTERL